VGFNPVSGITANFGEDLAESAGGYRGCKAASSVEWR
jgi:hypothetical protein